MYRPGDIFYQDFCTSNVSGISANADATPWARLVRNGLDDFSATVFVTNVDVGRYVVSGVIPAGYALGNSVNVCVSGYAGSNLIKAIINLGQLDTSYVGSLSLAGSVTVTGIAPGVIVGVTGIVQSNVVTWSGVPVAAPGRSGAILSDLRYVNGTLAQTYNGIAQAGGTGTITLSATESTVDNYYQWDTLALVGGTAANQFGMIVAYSGSTKVAYMDHSWLATPDNTTQYSFIGYGRTNPTYVQGQALSSKVGVNYNTFFQNAGVASTTTMDTIVASGTGGTADWTSAERSQLRYKLGIDGTAIAPASGFGHLELSASGVEQVMTETNVNLRQATTINSAVLCGTSSGAGSIIWYQGINKTAQNRLSSNAISGIRSTVNYVLP